MSTSTLLSPLHRVTGRHAAQPKPVTRAIALVARWCARRFARPQYHRLGAFDLARSGLARDLLDNTRR